MTSIPSSRDTTRMEMALMIAAKRAKATIQAQPTACVIRHNKMATATTPPAKLATRKMMVRARRAATMWEAMAGRMMAELRILEEA